MVVIGHGRKREWRAIQYRNSKACVLHGIYTWEQFLMAWLGSHSMYSAKWSYVSLDVSNNILGFTNNLLQDANNRGCYM